MKLWNEFNNAWLALGYRQRELMLASEDESSPLQRRLMSEASIRKLGNELIRLCDGLERHGLVDYQYGVWEDQIESGRRPPSPIPRASVTPWRCCRIFQPPRLPSFSFRP